MGLQVLNVSGNPLREFSPALCPYLKELKLNACQVNQLNISKNIYLTSLECSGNQLTELDLSENQFLQALDCSANKMTSLDVSPVRWLQSLNASDNPLQTLYLYATQKIEKPNVPPETRWVYLINSLSLNQETLHLPIGASFQLQPTILPEDTIDKTVEWLSSDYEVATVTSEGLVSGISVGDCTITAFCGGKEATITVHVIEVPISSVELKPGILEMNEGDTFQLQATVLPENATEKTVLWESSDPDIASVDEGEVTAHKSGIAIITARAGDASANCTVTVSKSIIPVASITLSETSLSLVEGESATLVATVLPEDATERTVEWTSSDEQVAVVSGGTITAIREGTAQIVATAGEKSASCTVTVSKGFVPVFSISLNERDLEMIEGDTFTLVATILPEDATDKTVAWWTSNPQVAVVTGGEVTALQEGSATIIATAGDESATCAVIVIKKEGEVHPEFVDLGLSVMWATFNVGATSPEEYGDYFAWGETEPKSDYSWETYKFWVEDDDVLKFNKYCPSDQDYYWGGSGSPDNKTVLDLEDDAAHVNWGGNWRMPTLAELQELLDNCTWTWITQGGVYGYRITSSNGNDIFLPAAGLCNGSKLGDVGISGYYRSSSLFMSDLDFAYYIWKDMVQPLDRYLGGSVRPVYGVFLPVNSVSLELSSLDLVVGESYILSVTISPSNATEKTVHWSSSDWSIASVNDEGRVFAVRPGTATITAYGSSGVSAVCTVTVQAVPSSYPEGIEAVDLGLPSGLKWASMNVGATSPEGYGDYFAWGETEPKNDYSWATYKWCNGEYNKLTKYCTDSVYGNYWDGIGPMDNKTVLDPEDDAAHVNWGGSWRMPTSDEQKELFDNCTWEWITQNGVNGRKVTGPNGKSIFLPAAGVRNNTYLRHVGSLGNYWSSSLGTSYQSIAYDVSNAYDVHFVSDGYSWTNGSRSDGLSVRPVSE